MAVPSHLKALQALELAVRTGSLKVAGETLSITPAAVGQRIKALEDYLGVELLERGRAGVRPGPALAAAAAHLHQGFEALEAAARELDLQRAHELHIAAASDFVDLWLAPRLPRFREAHPNIRFCINGEGDVPIRLGRVDCDISFGPVGEEADADLLFRDFIVPVASPMNLNRVASLPPELMLEGFPLLHLDFYKDDPAGLSWPEWLAANGLSRTGPERGMRFQRIVPALDAMEANAGIGLCGLALILDRVTAGDIGFLCSPAKGIWSSHGFCARFRPDSAAKHYVNRFRAWLRAESERTADGLVQAAAGRLDGI